MEQTNTTSATYSATELAAKARSLFGTLPEVVTAALKTAEKDTATVDEAKEIVQKFLQREVK